MPTTTAIAASASGDTPVVAALADKSVRVLAFVLSFGGTVNAKFKSGDTTDLTGLMYGVAGSQVSSPDLPESRYSAPPGQFQTARGEALNLNLSGAVAVGGYVVWEPAV